MAEPQSQPSAQRDGADTLADYGLNKVGWAAYWKDELQRRSQTLQKFRQRGQEVIRRYLDARGGFDQGVRRFNILWSNVNTLLPAVYDEEPKPICSRRYLDADPVARVASLMLERVLSFHVSTSTEVTSAVRSALQDRLLPGVGTVWVRFDDGGQTNIKGPDQLLPVTNRPVTERIDERAAVDFVQWSDFVWGAARTWSEVPYVARRVYMTRKSLTNRFGEIGKTVPLKHRAVNDPYEMSQAAGSRNDDPEISPAAQGVFGTGEVWEIWDKRTRTVTWLNTEIGEPLDTKDDPLKFPDFWPCPKPLFATLSSEALLPTADYYFYQDQAQELDIVSQRIAMLTKAIKVVGVYDRGQDAIKQLLRDGFDNDLIPVDTWAAFAEKGGIKGCVDFLPIDQVMEVLNQLYQVKNNLKQDIYEITGLADIIRGASIANETATAQRIKSQFANIRLTDLQEDVSRFLTDIFRMMAHIAQSYFLDSTLRDYSAIDQTPDGKQALEQAQQAMQQQMQQAMPQPQQGPPQGGPPMGGPPQEGPPMGGNVVPMPGMQQPPQQEMPPPQVSKEDAIEAAIQLLRNSRLSEFRICVEDSSRSEPDIVQERQMRTEYLTALTQFLQQAVPAAQSTPQLVPMFVSIMMWTLRSFRVGKDIEGQLEQALSSLQSSAQQGGPQKPDPEMVKAQAAQQKAEAEVKVMEQKLQLAEKKSQQDMQQDQQRFMQEMQQDQQRFMQEMQQMLMKAQNQQQAAGMEMQTALAKEQIANTTGPGTDAPVNPLNGEG